MQDTNVFPGLKRAALCIAYDNNIINRNHSEEEFLGNVDAILGADGVYYDDLAHMDAFLVSLSDEQMSNLCCGEYMTEQRPVLEMYSGDKEKLDGLLNDIFEA